MYQDLENEIIETFNNTIWNELDSILEQIIDNDFEDIEINNYTITCSKEKVHQLQANICVSIEFADNEIELMYESGINNGTELNDYTINSKHSLTDVERHYDVVIDVIVDYDRMDLLGVNYSKRKVEILLNNNKQELLSLVKNQNYDNYVTGGGTNKTNKYYKDKHEELNNKGLYFKYITETHTVMADFS